MENIFKLQFLTIWKRLKQIVDVFLMKKKGQNWHLRAKTSWNKRAAAFARATRRGQSGKDKRVCSHATAPAYCRVHKHRRLFVVDKRISMSMGARRQRGGVGGRRRGGDKGGGAIDGEVSDSVDEAEWRRGFLFRRRRRLIGGRRRIRRISGYKSSNKRRHDLCFRQEARRH